MSIILMSDLRELRINKQKELDFYNAELSKLLARMSIVQAEVNLTTRIIDMIEHETVASPVWARV